MAFRGLSAEVIESYKRTPALKPPRGVTPNFENPPSLKTATITVGVLFTVISTFFVAMRAYTRHFVLKRMWWDDYLSILAWMLFTCGTATLFLVEQHGAGIHEWNLTFYDTVQINYSTVISKAVYILDILMLKLSTLLQILRIFVPNRSISRLKFLTIVTFMAANTVFYIIELCLAVKQCTPRERSWNKRIPGHCIGSSNIVYTAAFNVVSDIVIFVLPLHGIWRLQMSFKKRVGVSLIFSTGLLAVAASVLRLYYSFHILHVRDTSFYDLVLGLCLYGELFVGFIVGCMPTLPKFGSEMKGAWSSARSKLLGSDAKFKLSGRFSGDRKSSKDRNDDSHNRFKVGAIQLDDRHFHSLDQLEGAHMGAA